MSVTCRDRPFFHTGLGPRTRYAPRKKHQVYRRVLLKECHGVGWCNKYITLIQTRYIKMTINILLPGPSWRPCPVWKPVVWGSPARTPRWSDGPGIHIHLHPSHQPGNLARWPCWPPASRTREVLVFFRQVDQTMRGSPMGGGSDPESPITNYQVTRRMTR